jgi:hypothetical protein
VNPIDISRRTRAIGAPADWDQKLDGECSVLPVRDEKELLSGVNFMHSLWQPNETELRMLNDGLPVLLRVSGGLHPVVSVGVATKADLV